MKMAYPITDITIEIFNHCAGSCTGCLLSVLERKAAHPSLSLEQFDHAMAELSAWGQKTGIIYRPVLVFGDVPWLPLEIQESYYAAATKHGHKLGATMTLVEADKTAHYWQGLDLLIEADNEAVFDITLDPVRLETDEGYAARVNKAIKIAPHLHLQALLSEVVLKRYSPSQLEGLFADILGAEHPISLGFTPSLTNLARKNYGYNIDNAASYAKAFYDTNIAGRKHLKAELKRLEADGSFADFLTQSFHIGSNMEVFPVAYTIYGDVFLDRRNGGKPLGHLEKESLEDIVTGAATKRFSVQNDIGMDMGDFNCADCVHQKACRFHGVGQTRRLYRKFEAKTGNCYGPKGFGSQKV